MARPPGPRAFRAAMLLLVALTAAACASDSEPSSEITPTAPPASDAPATDSADAEGSATDPPAETTDEAGTQPDKASTDSDPSPETGTEAPADEPLPDGPLPDGPLPIPAIALEPIGDFDQPVEVARRPGDPRPFVVEKAGRVLATGDSQADVVLDLTGTVRDDGNEQGLLGLAFHPTADLAYVHFSDSDGSTVVAELAVDPGSGSMDPGSLRTLFRVDQPFANHNGGELDFGPDGLLYLGLGDGGSADDPLRASLDLSTPLGKILRIDPVGSADAPFTVPADNPFVDATGADPRVWSIGLRNPWKFSFDSATGDLWIADVGQNTFEEVSVGRATEGLGAGRGTNFGWSAFEGDERFNDDQPTDGHVPPVLTYAHEDGRCSISGGVVARSSSVADLNGWLLYGDYCSGELFGYDTTSAGDEPVVVVLGSADLLTAVAEAGDGEIYVASQTGSVSRIGAG